MTRTTYSLEIIKVKRDLRTLDRDRIYLDYVMNYLRRFIDSFTQTILTKIMSPLHVFVAALLPRLRAVKLPGEFLSHG